MIPISQLAQLMGTEEKFVQKLIKLGYLKRGKGKMVELPPRAALQWLKLMLQPLPSRPLFTVPEVLQLSGLTLKMFRKIILAWNIPLYYDLAFGELISPDSLIAFINALHQLREPVRFDRAVLLNWMQGMGSNRAIRPKLPYSKLIEAEIARIARLKQPERTIQARAFHAAFRDAKLVSNALNYESSRRIGGNLERNAMVGKLGTMILDVRNEKVTPHERRSNPPAPSQSEQAPPRSLDSEPDEEPR